jgi:hypothetical protein
LDLLDWPMTGASSEPKGMIRNVLKKTLVGAINSANVVASVNDRKTPDSTMSEYVPTRAADPKGVGCARHEIHCYKGPQSIGAHETLH